ncbi:hypothetical protein BSLA_01f0897 [Burkholderia stabilis]|nr:hypothetical protein BSLA_01f0897 [Burkholderia stabilis]
MDIRLAKRLEALWFSTVRVRAWPDGGAGPSVDNCRCGHSKRSSFQR